MAERYLLLGCRGCGNVVVEAALTLAGLPFEYEEADFENAGPDRDRLLKLNPLGQSPTLILPDGTVMTESAAIVLMINDIAPAANLVPPPGAPERNAFLRWLIFLVAAIYPTFTYGEEPARWLAEGTDSGQLRESTDRQREHSWRLVESAIVARPWFLGERFSALDLYLAAMTHWRPRTDWFRIECPKAFAVGAAAERLPALNPLFRKHFG